MIDRIQAAWRALVGSPTTKRTAVWDAAGAGSRLQQWAPPSTAFATNLTAPALKERSRDLYRNSPWARRLVDSLVVGAVGAGIKPQFRAADAGLKQRVQAEWLAWTDQADFAGRFDFYGLQQAALKALLIDGECFLRLVLDPAQRVPLQLQLLPAEFLDSTRVDDRTLNGIEYDAAGRRVAYWLYRRHPAEAPDMQSVRVPAEQVIHLYVPIQPGVERGVPWLAPIMTALHELRQFEEAAVVRARVAAILAGFVHTPDGLGPLQPDGGLPQLEPGSMVRLSPGEDIQFNEVPDFPNYEQFVRGQLRAITAALNIPYEIAGNDVSAVTYASGRHALLEYQRHLESLQHHVLVFQLCRPVWANWTRAAMAAGVLPEGDYSTVRWIAPRLQMLDSRMETQNIIQQIRGGLLSRAEAVSAMGWDVEQIDAEIAQDNARADALGLVFDSDARRRTQQGQDVPDVVAAGSEQGA
jgi:lambda family phage portal protein